MATWTVQALGTPTAVKAALVKQFGPVKPPATGDTPETVAIAGIQSAILAKLDKAIAAKVPVVKVASASEDAAGNVTLSFEFTSLTGFLFDEPAPAEAPETPVTK